MNAVKDPHAAIDGKATPRGIALGQMQRRDRSCAGASSPALGEKPAVVILQRDERLGDAITHLPAYFALRHAYPDHRVIGLFHRDTVFESTLSRVRSMFFDEIHCGFPLDNSLRHLPRFLDGLGGVDCVVDFRANKRTILGLLGSRGRSRGYVANTAGYSLRRGVAGFAEPRPEQNVHRFHRLIEIIAGRHLPFEYRLPQLAEAQQHAAALLPDARRYFGFVVTLPELTKAWPLENLFAAARYAAEMGRHPAFLIGPWESGLRETIRTSVPEAILIDAVAARNDTNYLPWLFLAAADRLAGIVAADCGVAHLVATRNIPVLTLAGPNNLRRWRPITPFWWLLDAHDFGSHLVSAIPVDTVRRTIADMLRWSDHRGQQADLLAAASSETAVGPLYTARVMS